MSNAATAPKPIPCPFRIVVDTNEKLPYQFSGITANADRKHAPIIVNTVRRALPHGRGDYTIDGPIGEFIAIERKTASDLFGSMARMDNFKSRLDLMSKHLEVSFIIIESEVSDIYDNPPSEFNPKALMRLIMSWELNYPNVHWRFLPNRQVAESYTFHYLNFFYKRHSQNFYDGSGDDAKIEDHQWIKNSTIRHILSYKSGYEEFFANSIDGTKTWTGFATDVIPGDKVIPDPYAGSWRKGVQDAIGCASDFKAGYARSFDVGFAAGFAGLPTAENPEIIPILREAWERGRSMGDARRDKA